jgi:HK97 family phage prohead protease
MAPTSNYETRFLPELRATEEGRLVGYAAVFNSLSADLGGYVERIDPHAFDRTLRETPDVVALVEHDPNRVLGRVSNGSVRLKQDEHGLRVEIEPADTTYARDVLALVRRGDVAGMSFRFRPYPGGDSMDLNQSPPLRTLKSVELVEVSVVLWPAYPETSVSVRALEKARALAHAMRRRRLRLAAY